jgi:hypothetical protein
MILNFAVSFSFSVDCLGKSEPVLCSFVCLFFFFFFDSTSSSCFYYYFINLVGSCLPGKTRLL